MYIDGDRMGGGVNPNDGLSEHSIEMRLVWLTEVTPLHLFLLLVTVGA